MSVRGVARRGSETGHTRESQPGKHRAARVHPGQLVTQLPSSSPRRSTTFRPGPRPPRTAPSKRRPRPFLRSHVGAHLGIEDRRHDGRSGAGGSGFHGRWPALRSGRAPLRPGAAVPARGTRRFRGVAGQDCAVGSLNSSVTCCRIALWPPASGPASRGPDAAPRTGAARHRPAAHARARPVQGCPSRVSCALARELVVKLDHGAPRDVSTLSMAGARPPVGRRQPLGVHLRRRHMSINPLASQLMSVKSVMT